MAALQAFQPPLAPTNSADSPAAARVARAAAAWMARSAPRRSVTRAAFRGWYPLDMAAAGVVVRRRGGRAARAAMAVRILTRARLRQRHMDVVVVVRAQLLRAGKTTKAPRARSGMSSCNGLAHDANHGAR